MKLIQTTLFTAAVLVATTAVAYGQTPLTGDAQSLYQQAQQGRFYSHAEKLKPELISTSDGKSFLVVWRAVPAPKHWIVSLHGSHGFATDDLALWSDDLKGRDVGFVGMQWWKGRGDETEDYYTPKEIYQEIDLVLTKLGVSPGSAMLHGFSRGSANSYAVAALDAGRGKHYFSLFVASSGGVGLNYPPTRAIGTGEYGQQPLTGTKWITVAGARDPHPDRDGVEGMRAAAKWLQQQGAVVLESIEDPNEGHGALQRNPTNLKRVLDRFLGPVQK